MRIGRERPERQQAGDEAEEPVPNDAQARAPAVEVGVDGPAESRRKKRRTQGPTGIRTVAPEVICVPGSPNRAFHRRQNGEERHRIGRKAVRRGRRFERCCMPMATLVNSRALARHRARQELAIQLSFLYIYVMVVDERIRLLFPTILTFVVIGAVSTGPSTDMRRPLPTPPGCAA